MQRDQTRMKHSIDEGCGKTISKGTEHRWVDELGTDVDDVIDGSGKNA